VSYRVHIVDDARSLRDFLDLPDLIYRKDPAWVAPLRSVITQTLDPRKNPYFRGGDVQKFVCYHDALPVARAVSVINPRHWEAFGQKTAFFGFFECVDDPSAAGVLFDEIGFYCLERGAELLEGPLNPNHYSELGLLVRNFSMPAFFETYNPPYYAALLESAGFRQTCLLHTRVNKDVCGFLNARPPKNLSALCTGGYTIRNFNIWHLKADLERIREVYNDAFAGNWHFLPVSAEEYGFVTKALFLVTSPRLIQIVEHEGEPVGVIQYMYNVNPLLAPLRGHTKLGDILVFLWKKRKISEIVLYAVGIKKAYQKTKVLAMLRAALYQIAQKYPVMYSTWMSEDNIASVKASESIGMEPYKWFAIFEKQLTETVS
jgi:hypothetical protein